VLINTAHCAQRHMLTMERPVYARDLFVVGGQTIVDGSSIKHAMIDGAFLLPRRRVWRVGTLPDDEPPSPHASIFLLNINRQTTLLRNACFHHERNSPLRYQCTKTVTT
jgi:hypothetical protein